MKTMKYVVLLLANITIIMKNFNSHAVVGESNICSGREHSTLCFCHSSYRRSSLTELFLAKLFLFQCDTSLPIHHCYRSQFHPPTFHLTEFIPQVTNLSHCLEEIQCLHTLHSIQHCRRCQVTFKNSSRTDSCFDFCERDPSCGVLCLHQPIILSISCNKCQRSKYNISCRCINSSPSCLPFPFETTTPRWMQKRGFPAAAILVLLILAAALLVIAIKLIYRQLDIIDRRHSLATHQLLTNDLNTSRIIHVQPQQLVVEIHRCDEENELSILFLEKPSEN